MTVLSAESIRDYLRHDDPAQRLVVTPILDPKKQLKPNQGAIDVRLGRVFSLPKAWTRGVAELLEGDRPGTPVETIVVDHGRPLIVHPHQFVLARTLEILRLPPTLFAYVVGRSSWGRRGLTVATAVAVHPNFAGPLTLELKNVGEVPLALYPMDRIAQLVFHQVATPSKTGGADTRPSEKASEGENDLPEGTRAPGRKHDLSDGDQDPSTPAREGFAGRSQFAFGFVPGLGTARDEETLRRIIGLRQPKK